MSDYDYILSKNAKTLVKKKEYHTRKSSVWRNLFIALVILFLFLPIFVLVLFSFNQSEMNIVFTGFTTEWYDRMWKNAELMDAFRNTLFIAVASTIISTVLGTLAAVGLKKFKFFGRTFINNLIYIPIVISEIVLGLALLAVFSLTQVELGLWSVLIAHITFSTPFVINSVRSVLFSIPDSVEEAAEDLGASRWQTFFRVTLPLLKPGIYSGAILAFTLSLDDVVVSYFTAGPGTNTLPLYIYSIIKTGITPDVNALTTLMLLVTILLLFASYYIRSHENIKARLSGLFRSRRVGRSKTT
ncbi:ABC transporter permease [Candidatus Saccharibacteria bacterium]|nr:ABC transporter permease [Candidatus Saccharibacteria bacterium]